MDEIIRIIRIYIKVLFVFVIIYLLGMYYDSGRELSKLSVDIITANIKYQSLSFTIFCYFILRVLEFMRNGYRFKKSIIVKSSEFKKYSDIKSISTKTVSINFTFIEYILSKIKSKLYIIKKYIVSIRTEIILKFIIILQVVYCLNLYFKNIDNLLIKIITIIHNKNILSSQEFNRMLLVLVVIIYMPVILRLIWNQFNFYLCNSKKVRLISFIYLLLCVALINLGIRFNVSFIYIITIILLIEVVYALIKLNDHINNKMYLEKTLVYKENNVSNDECYLDVLALLNMNGIHIDNDQLKSLRIDTKEKIDYAKEPTIRFVAFDNYTMDHKPFINKED